MGFFSFRNTSTMNAILLLSVLLLVALTSATDHPPADQYLAMTEVPPRWAKHLYGTVPGSPMTNQTSPALYCLHNHDAKHDICELLLKRTWRVGGPSRLFGIDRTEEIRFVDPKASVLIRNDVLEDFQMEKLFMTSWKKDAERGYKGNFAGKEFLEKFSMYLRQVINKTFVADQKLKVVEKEEAGEGLTEGKEALDRQIPEVPWRIEGLMDFAKQKQS